VLSLAPLGRSPSVWAAPAGQDSGPGSSGARGDELEGRVVGINTLAPRPLVQLADLDGTVSVYFASVDAIVSAGIRQGDSLWVMGRRLSESEFEADTARVEVRGAIGRGGSPVGEVARHATA
jgi:hypothetical protein